MAQVRNARAAIRALASSDISSRRRTRRSRRRGKRGPTYVRAKSAASSSVRTITSRASRSGGSNTKSVMPRKLARHHRSSADPQDPLQRHEPGFGQGQPARSFPVAPQRRRRLSSFNSAVRCGGTASYPARIHRLIRIGPTIVCAFLVVSSGMTRAWADTSCVVSDPTGAPLNVRSPPNGPILGGAASRSSGHGRQDQIPPPPSLSG